jgi:hypothetical protein
MNMRTLFLFITCSILGTASIQAADNKTPGDDEGADHTAYAFNGYAFAGLRGENGYAKHVGVGTAAGQQYAISIYSQNSAGLSVPDPCTVANFYKIIHENENNLATLLFLGHGGNNISSVEPFALTAAGLKARDARYQDYLDGNVPGCPAFTTAEIYKGSNVHAYAVGIRSTFIRNHGKMNQSLTFIANCNGSTMTDDYVAADGRVAVGFTGTVTGIKIENSVTKFFSRMDGQEGIEKRPVAEAMKQLEGPIASSGNTKTTLAPAVKELDAPCPIAVGDKVTYTFDTTCEDNDPDIIGVNVTIENEVWISNTKLQGTCTAVANNGNIYSLKIRYLDIWSNQNIARLDGNTQPFLINARGPAHDDHIKWRFCPVYCMADLNDDATVNVADLLILLDSWGSHDGSLDLDESGVVDVADVLMLLASWGESCETGACCLESHCIDDVSSEKCLELGGAYLGDRSLCETSYTCVSIGACCFPPYECYENVFEEDCVIWGGIFEGEDTTCDSAECWDEPLGACCYDDLTCIDSMPQEVCESSGGYFLGPDTDCFEDQCPYFDQGGACCIDTEIGKACLDFTTQEECSFLGGEYRGPGTLCEFEDCIPLGACCVTVGDTPSCTDSVTPDLCEDGSWYEGLTCEEIEFECNPPWGACCLAEVNACWDGFSKIECEQSGGLFHEGQTCNDINCQPATGACCLLDGCEEMSLEDCTYIGGDYYGAGTSCIDLTCDKPDLIGACCWDDGTCTDEVDQNLCLDSGGLFHPQDLCDEVECIF